MTGQRNAKTGLVVAALLVMLAQGAAADRQAQSLCTTLPRHGWVSFEEIESRLKSGGYQLLRLRITNEACYAALVTNATGQLLELRVHPATSEVLFRDDTPTGAIRR